MGLEVFSLWTAINAFPDLLEGLFVSSDSYSPEDVLAIVKFSENFESDVEKSRVAGYFKNSVRKLEESGESEIIIEMCAWNQELLMYQVDV